MALFAPLALTVSAAEFEIPSSSLTRSGESHGVQTGIAAKPSLRGLKTTNDAPNEERGISQLAEKMKVWATKAKPGDKVRAWVQKRRTEKAEKRTSLIKSLAEKNFDNFDTIFRNKITPDEYFSALGFDYRLRFARRRVNDVSYSRVPGLRKWDGYEKFYYSKIAKPQ
ncbi:hypothetical protein PR002_g18827 [Phytophthora rubi]|nr:hypothetical protein PR002_g18827 [Phytophthora rubi]